MLQILQENSDIRDVESASSPELWDSSSVVLITYPDTVFRKGEDSLKTLSDFIDKKLGNIAKIIHVLPFLPSTSDGGFAVSNHDQIAPSFGNWSDLKKLSKDHNIMADLVLNHVSSSHKWVQQFIQSINPGTSYILSPRDLNGWDKVIRPRNTSLFIKLATKEGLKNTWTTFGPDQIDLDWQNPDILIEFLKLIVLYLKNGVSWIRLDAIAFIWKEKNTSCLHRDQVHQIVKLLRFYLENLVNKGVIITETNVPEAENLSYLKSGDEAHMAYNFPLPPLLLEALVSNKADLLNKWLCSWPSLPFKTTFLNFTASHDGIGLRPLEGLMTQNRLHELLVNCEKRGGLISHRKMENGEDSPYELNISWWSAMSDSGIDPSYLQVQRFLLSQLFTIALQGVPAFYLPAVLASENDIKSFGRSGERRDLNRERFDVEKLYLKLKDIQSFPNQIIRELNSAMEKRTKEISFHPDSPMHCLTKDRSDVVIITRGENKDKIWAIHNMTNSRLTISLLDSIFSYSEDSSSKWSDLLKDKLIINNILEVPPYNVMWLKRIN
ncbi:alpha-amylase family glycosyl hydrolase [Prochlorococcus sp. MIT 1223]|uniref:alpha-amylase family glycosyl hydrolase n=1 Tax=Prochlorococcus sp. MIT 1223 TaxID=3096217 RepID=UPI002A76610B|nr:alpha-amylase family glycosyl hydrolase [Prochlorococcus sp. MIT 1223]